MSPSVISTVRLAIRIAVVFPQPDGPTRTQISPAGTSRERLLIAGTFCPGYRLVTSRYETAAAWRPASTRAILLRRRLAKLANHGYHPPAADLCAALFM